MNSKMDPMGRAIAEYHRTGKAARLRVFSPMFEEDEIPLRTLFRTYQSMPKIEQTALDMENKQYDTILMLMNGIGIVGTQKVNIMTIWQE